MSLGQNLLLKDKKVIFQSTESFIHIKRLSSTVRDVHDSFGPVENVATETRNDVSYDDFPLLCRRRESNPHLLLGRQPFYH